MIGALHRFLRLSTPLGLLAATVLSMAGPAGAAPQGSAVDRFGSCVAAQKSGQVLLMIDESGSLKQTDPRAARVEAAKYLVDQLTQFSADSGAAIEVGVAGFADDFKQEVDWTRLSRDSLPGVESGIDAFRGRDDGSDTDYWLALNGARKALTDHAPKNAEGPACQALAWFTDGKIDYSVHQGVEKPYAPGQDLGSQGGVDATVRAAREDICRPGGVADQLRSSGIVTFGIGLAPDASKNADFDVLKSIVTGEPTSTGKCGEITSPSPGEFYLAQNIDDLLFAFDAFSTPGQPPAITETGACPGIQICEDGKHRFVLDRSVSSVSVLASADAAGLIPVLVPPTGPPQELKPGTSAQLDFGGVAVDYKWLSDKSVSFRMTNASAPGWQGVWALVFEDPSGTATARTKSSIHISGDLYPAWPDRQKTALRQNATVPLVLSIVDDQGKPIDASTLLGKVELSATLIDARGANHPIATGLTKNEISQPQQLDLHGVDTGSGTLRLTLAVTTADSVDQAGAAVPGTVLAPRSVDLPVTVDPPVGYPTVSSQSIDFGTLQGAGNATGTVEIKGPGCVWLPGDESPRVVAAPEGVGNVTITSPANGQSTCVKATDGASGTVPVAITVPQEDNGAINGTVALTVAPDDASAPPLKVDVPFTLSVEKKIKEGTVWLTAVIALLLGPGIPLLLLYLVKWSNARIPAKALRAQQIGVRVSGGSVSRNGQPFGVRDGELVQLVEGLTGPTRRLTIGDVDLRARTGLSPFGAGHVVASAPGLAGAAGKDGATSGKTPHAKLPLAVQNTWFVLHDPNGAEDVATVVLLVGGDAGRGVVDRLVAEVTESLPRVLPDLRARAKPAVSDDGDAPPPKRDSPFGSTPSGAAGAGNPFQPSPSSSSGSGPFGGAGSAPRGGGPFGTGTPSPGGGGPFGAGADAPPRSTGNPFGGAPRQEDDPPSGNPFSPGRKPGSDPPNPFRP